MIFIDLFNKHLKEVNMDYRTHFINTFLLGTYIGVSSIKIMIHSIFPFLFENTENEVIKYSDYYLKLIYKDN